MTAICTVPVEWYIPPVDDEDMPSYRKCDMCYLSAVEDAIAGKNLADFRQFVKVIGGNDDGLNVCEHCLDTYLNEKPL